MSVKIETPEAGPKLFKFTVEQFLTSIDVGAFPHDAGVELICGIVVHSRTKQKGHDYALDTVAEALRLVTPKGCIVREAKSLDVDKYSRLVPDIAIIRGERSQFAQRAPQARETMLIVEVSDSTYWCDRGVKSRRYASARIPAYWILDLQKRQIEVHTEPAGKGKNAIYQRAATFGLGTSVPVMIDGIEVGKVDVKEILP